MFRKVGMEMPKRNDGLSHEEVLAKKREETISRFLKAAKAKHGDKYDYSQLNFTETRKPVTIICPKHGPQQMNMYTHLNGTGCPECTRDLQKDTLAKKFAHLGEEFTTKAKKVHGDKYDYSKVKWINTDHKVEIVCPKHGSFWVLPSNHLRGSLCPKCNLESRTMSTDEWKALAREKHGNKYDYSESVYQGFSTPVKIICPKHGEFWQAGGAHAQLGQGCFRCAAEESNSHHLMSKDEFIQQARRVHGDYYDYSHVEPEHFYRNQEVKIICPKHGSFYQLVSKHLLGAGCLKCAGKDKMSTEEFITALKDLYGNKYKYDRIKYLNKYTFVELGCPIHGYVKCRPESLMLGKGCRMCNASQGEVSVEEWLKEHRFPYVREFSLPGYTYRYDFALPEYKILIEYDGQQHFMPIDYYGGEEGYRKRVGNDKIKTKLARDNGWVLIRLPYTLEERILVVLRGQIANHYPYTDGGKLYATLNDLVKHLEGRSVSESERQKYTQYKTRLLNID